MSSRPLKNPYPSPELWEFRHKWFSYEMGQALGSGDLVGVSTKQTRVLELELETVFCAGAWLATIVLACAAAEVYVAGQDAKKEAKFLGPYGLREEWIWLQSRRNEIVHSTARSPTDIAGMSYEQTHMENEAKRAVAAALKILLLGTRVKLDTSIERDA